MAVPGGFQAGAAPDLKPVPKWKWIEKPAGLAGTPTKGVTMRASPVSYLSILSLAALGLFAIAPAAAVELVDAAYVPTQEKPVWVTQDGPRQPQPVEPPPPPRRARAGQAPEPPREPLPPAPPVAPVPPVPPVPPAPPEPADWPRAEFLERLMPLVGERHPELAERLRRLRQRSPEEFRRVLADALAVRLDEVLNQRPDRPISPQWRERESRFPGRPEEIRPERIVRRGERPEREVQRPGGPLEALEQEMQELHRHNEELERRSAELAERFNELRERRGPEPEEMRAELRRAIEETTQEHFNVRTELRRIELRRIEIELDRLREMLERIRQDLERREHSRGVIIERRLHELLGDGGESW